MAPDHPREWSSEPLAELADPNVPHSFIDGDWIESPYITDSGVRLIQTGNVGTGSFKDKSNRKFVSQDSFKELGCKYVMPGDLLFCRLADPIGRSCRAPTLDGPMLTSVDVTIMRPNPKRVVTDYLVQLSNSNRWLRRAAELAGGSTRSRISRSNLGKMTVPLPPLPEQRKIAEILGSVDEAIRATEAVIEQTRKVKEGLLQELLTKGIGHTKFKQTEIGEIPVGWEVVPLEDMGLNSRDVLKSGPFGSSLKGEHFTSEGHPVLNIQCLGDGELQDGHFFVSSDTAEELRGYAIEKGDLVFSRVADVGRSVVIPESAAGWIISSNLMRIRLDKARFVSEFVMYQITHGLAVAHQLGGSVNDAGRQIVNGKTMRKLLFPMPPIAEQERLVGVSVGLDEEMRRSRAVQDGLAALKQGLLQDLLTGKVRVKV